MKYCAVVVEVVSGVVRLMTLSSSTSTLRCSVWIRLLDSDLWTTRVRWSDSSTTRSSSCCETPVGASVAARHTSAPTAQRAVAGPTTESSLADVDVGTVRRPISTTKRGRREVNSGRRREETIMDESGAMQGRRAGDDALLEFLTSGWSHEQCAAAAGISVGRFSVGFATRSSAVSWRHGERRGSNT